MRVVDIKDSFLQRPVHPSFGWVKPVMDGKKYGWMGGGRVKTEGAKNETNSSRTILYDHQLCLEVESECKLCRMCVCSPFHVN